MCPPASEMMLDFPIMSSKMTFLQWNHLYFFSVREGNKKVIKNTDSKTTDRYVSIATKMF
jgi:hypothetical protein